MSIIEERFKSYKTNFQKSKEWFETNYDKIKQLFENGELRGHIFEPFVAVFDMPDKTINIDKNVYIVITQVALINAILGGIPGQMGIGMYVSMALEAWMAYTIAKHMGIELEKPSAIFKYFSILMGVGLTILFSFKHLASFVFSIVSIVVPLVNPLIFIELMVTNFIGVLFWIGFQEVKEGRKFAIPFKRTKEIGSLTKQIFQYQFEVLKERLNGENIKLVGRRFKEWLSSETLERT